MRRMRHICIPINAKGQNDLRAFSFCMDHEMIVAAKTDGKNINPIDGMQTRIIMLFCVISSSSRDYEGSKYHAVQNEYKLQTIESD